MSKQRKKDGRKVKKRFELTEEGVDDAEQNVHAASHGRQRLVIVVYIVAVRRLHARAARHAAARARTVGRRHELPRQRHAVYSRRIVAARALPGAAASRP